MSRTPSQREALRHYQQARDIEHNLLDNAGKLTVARARQLTLEGWVRPVKKPK